MSRIKTNVVGKVGNISLPHENGIMALHEAIVNSLHAIDDSKRSDGDILIEVRRNLLVEPLGNGLQPIQDIAIRDNGVGFNRRNFNSFQTAESTYKQKRGGKGIGRFLWLKVFNRAEIRSVFRDSDDKLYNRSFEFVLDNRDPIVDVRLVPVPAGEERPVGTSIKLCGLHQEYSEAFDGTLSDLADAIIEHHIHFLVDDSCPTITLREQKADSSSVEINLNHRFQHDFMLDKDADSIQLGGYPFEVALLKIKSEGRRARHSLLLSANKRVVTSQLLAPLVPNLDQLLQHESGQPFDIFVLVSGIWGRTRVRTETIGRENLGRGLSQKTGVFSIR